MTSELLAAGAQLDEHHAPETNGRIAVCRRCGLHTDSPTGEHHLVAESQRTRSSEWLLGQARLRDIEAARIMRAN